jgi:sialidase-1
MNSNHPFFRRTALFRAGEGGYATYRIPAIAVTMRGALLAFCAARVEPGDWSEIAIALRRSTDSGATWSPMHIIASRPGATVDNPTPIVDRETGTVHFLHQVNYERCCYLRSDDDGLSWSDPVDITPTLEQFRPEYPWTVIAPGPGHGIQLRNGRLIAPVWLSTGAGTEFGTGKRGHRPSVVSVITSDDHGVTWERGEIVARHSAEMPNPSETAALELNDGRVLLNIRSESKRNRRLISVSADGATGWSAPCFHEELFEPVCFASLIRYSEQPSRILFANPDSQHSGGPALAWGAWRRENLTVRLSCDEGETWPLARVVDPGVAGYSDLAVDASGAIHCLYEGGDVAGNIFHNSHLSLATFNLPWLMSKGEGVTPPTGLGAVASDR